MKHTKLFLAAVLLLTPFFVGCTPMTPAIQADNAQILGLQKDIASIKAQSAAAATQPIATQPAGIAAEAARAASLAADNAALAAANAKLSADNAASQRQLVQNLTTGAQAAGGAAGGPWAPAIVAAIGLASLLIQSKMHSNTVQTVSDNNAETAQKTSDNNTAAVQTAVTGLVNSVPVASLPAKFQEAAKIGIAAVNAGAQAIPVGPPATVTPNT